MRQALRSAKVATASIPAPVGGLNALVSIADMPPTDAIQMDNWVPLVSSVNVRNGYAAHKTGFGAQVKSLMAYNSATANDHASLERCLLRARA